MPAAGFGVPSNGSGDFAFRVDPDGNVKIGDESSDHLEVTGSVEIKGTLGISEATMSPTALLHVSQSSDSGGDTSLFRVDAFHQTNPAIDIKDNGSEAYIGINTSAATNALTVDAHSAGALAVRATNGHIGTTQDNYGLKIGTAAKSLVHDGTDFVLDDSIKISGSTILGTHTSAHLHQITGTVGMNNKVHILTNGRVGIGTDSPDYRLDVAGNVGFNEYIYHNGDADTFIRFQNDSINLQAGGADFITLTESTQDEVVINENSTDIDFRVESNGETHMLFVDGGLNRVGVGVETPLTLMHLSASATTECALTLQGQSDVGIRLAADKGNSTEGNNPYIDFYQDGQAPTSRNNRLATIAMEGDAGTSFTNSLANALYIDTFCPNAANSNLRQFQIATDCSSSADGANHSARLTIEGGHGYVGIHKNNPAVELDVDGTMNATTLQIGGTAVTSTAAELNLLDASVASEASDGQWAIVERIAKATLDSNDWPLSSTPVSLGVTIPDNAILTKIVFDTTQTFAAGDNGSADMSVVDFGLYNGNTQVIQFASQTMIGRTGAQAGDKPYYVGVTEIFPITAGLSAKLTAALTVKFHNIDDGSGMMNNLDAGALDVYIYYIIGA